MDDMWSIDAWDKIQRYFPNNGNGSRILVTTRLSQLGSQLNNTYCLQMNFLDEVSSWDLFSRTVFGDGGSCPHELKDIGKKIVDNCRGLPLSIVVVGGIFKRMEQTKICWESIMKNLTSVVNLENDEHCLRLLKLSYNQLPMYLKPCFLYMGVFEEDAEIRVSILIKLWVSEGFLKPMSDICLETLGKGFLKDLVDRNLILIHKLGSTGNIKSCKIHDLLRDLCLNEGQRDGFHHIIGRYSPQGINRQCRRVVIPRNTSKEKVVEDLKSMQHARSIICEYGKVPRYQNFGLLRTFHAYKGRGHSEFSYMNTVASEYVNLRHLAIEVRSMFSFFSYSNLFWNLHTLIIACWDNRESSAPAEMWKMTQFRHIGSYKLRLPDPPKGKDDDDVVIMKNLRTIKGVRKLKWCEEVVKRIPNMKKLKLTFSGQLKGTELGDYYCVANIKFLGKLESLSVHCEFGTKGTTNLQKLSFPQSLKKLELSMNDEFEWEAVLEKIGSLPCLEKLILRDGWFKTGRWQIFEVQFPKLKYMGLFSCKGLKQWTVEGSSVLPHLEQLHLEFCKELEEIPSEIGEINTLQKISLKHCSINSAILSAKAIVEEQVELQGDQLPFHVQVEVIFENKALKSFENCNFMVSHL